MTKTDILSLSEEIEINPNRHSGKPVLKGTRFPVASIFAEMANGRSHQEIAEDFDLNPKQISKLFQEIAQNLDVYF